MELIKYLLLPENKALKEEIKKRWTKSLSDGTYITASMITIDSDLQLRWKCLENEHYFNKSIKDIIKHGFSCTTCEREIRRKRVLKEISERVEIKDANGNKRIMSRGRVIGLKSIEALENNKEKLKNLKNNSLYTWCKNNGEHGKQILNEFTGIDKDGLVYKLEDLTHGTDKKLYWICQNNPNHVFAARIKTRTYMGSGCKICGAITNGTGYEEQFLYHAFKSVIPETENSKFLFNDEYKGGLNYDLYIPYKENFILIEYGNSFTHNENHPDRVKRDQLKKKKALSNNCKFISILDDQRNEYDEKWEEDSIVLKISHTPDKEERLLKIVKYILNNFNISTETLDNTEILQELKDIAWVSSKGSGLSEERSLKNIHPILAKEILPELNGGLTARDLMPNSHKRVKFRCNHCGNEWPARVNGRVYGESGCPECGYNPFREEKGLPQKLKSKYR